MSAITVLLSCNPSVDAGDQYYEHAATLQCIGVSVIEIIKKKKAPPANRRGFVYSR
jgi:hypothetical protein